MWRGKLTPRKAMALIRQLPMGAQTWGSMGVDEAWTVGEHMSAAQVDLLTGANWQRSGGKGKQPTPVDRPSDLQKVRRRQEGTQLRASRFIEKQRRRPLAQPAPERPERPRDQRGRFVSRKGE